jgi:hypothetical protein
VPQTPFSSCRKRPLDAVDLRSANAAALDDAASTRTIRNAASARDGSKPSKTATHAYRDALARVWVLGEVPAS